MTDKKSIHELGLHERTYEGGYWITRVPGGWIYKRETAYVTKSNDDVHWVNSEVFVPYHEEFAPDKEDTEIDQQESCKHNFIPLIGCCRKCGQLPF